MLTFETVFHTDKGLVRTYNEDAGSVAFHTSEKQCFGLIADGMGGHRAGDVASNMLIDFLNEQYTLRTALFTTPTEAEQWLQEMIGNANKLLHNHAKNNKDCEGMGTTLVAALCTATFVTIAHVGDSRCYLHNAHSFRQVTEDHSLVNELVKNGVLTNDDAKNHPRKNVLVRAIGTDEFVEVDIQTLAIDEEFVPKILLCTDGLSNKVSDDEIEKLIASEEHVQTVAETLCQEANNRGGEDNITLVLISYKVGEHTE
ncbi:MAG: Stp1/IreP family PP2C-type Ser/Thr phosphatase [Bacilli bacterium]